MSGPTSAEGAGVRLAVRVTSTAVHVAGLAPNGATIATSALTLRHHRPAPDQVETSPEEVWQGTLSAVAEVGAALPEGWTVVEVAVGGDPHTLLVWDRETLGAPRPAITAGDRRTTGLCEQLRAEGAAAHVELLADQPLDHRVAGPRLRWLAEHEPHTWALVEDGRYAVGGVESYLVARMTRGLEHVTDAAHARPTLLLGAEGWSEELCALFGVPPDALPELVEATSPAHAPTPRADARPDLRPDARPDLRVGAWGRTDPRTFAGLAVPVSALAPA